VGSRQGLAANQGSLHTLGRGGCHPPRSTKERHVMNYQVAGHVAAGGAHAARGTLPSRHSPFRGRGGDVRWSRRRCPDWPGASADRHYQTALLLHEMFSL
jgi:hypothetical protein